MADEEKLFKNALLGIVVPEASGGNIADVLAGADDDSDDSDEVESILPAVKQRSLLFFDERLPVYLVLQFPLTANDSLRNALPRLDLRLDCIAVAEEHGDNLTRKGAAPPGAGKDTIFSQRLENIGDPYIALGEVGEEGSVAYAIWETQATLNRPRVRLPNPSVVFSAIGSFKPSEDSEEEEEDLPAFQPLPTNVLDAFKSNPMMKDHAPFLYSTTLERILPSSTVSEAALNLQSQQTQPFRIIPAVSARVRYSRLNTFAQRPQTVASLDFEVTPYIRHDVELDVATVALSDGGKAEPISPVEMPVICRPRDDLCFLYTLTPSDQAIGHGSSTLPISTLEICFSSKVQISETCTPRITMKWRTSIDFTVTINPVYGAPSQILQRSNRPSNLASLPSNPSANTTTTVGGHQSLTSTSPDTSLTISFTAPSTPIILGSLFSWQILIVNHSPRPRKLAIIAITSRSTHSSRGPAAANRKDSYTSRHAPRLSLASHRSYPSLDHNTNTTAKFALPNTTSISTSTTTLAIPTTTLPPNLDIAPAFLDENILHTLQRSSLLNPSSTSTSIPGSGGGGAPLICMTPDIRIGPLNTNGTHECEMRFLTLRSGWNRIEGVKVVDVDGVAPATTTTTTTTTNAAGAGGARRGGSVGGGGGGGGEAVTTTGVAGTGTGSGTLEWMIRDLPDIWVVDDNSGNSSGKK